MIPPHIQRHRITQCLIDSRGIGPHTIPGHCRQCGRSILAAWEEGYGPNTAIVDPYPLTPEGELFALLDGRATYLADGWRARQILTRRQAYPDATPTSLTAHSWTNIAAHPAAPDVTVYATHQCGRPIPPHYPTAGPRHRAGTDQPPF